MSHGPTSLKIIGVDDGDLMSLLKVNLNIKVTFNVTVIFNVQAHDIFVSNLLEM